MASVSNEGQRPPGRTALAGMAVMAHDNPEGGKPGLVITELVKIFLVYYRITIDEP